MLIEEQYELFSGASPLSEPFLIEPNKEGFEDLPSKYFENDEVRRVITLMVRNRVPQSLIDGKKQQNENDKKSSLKKSKLHRDKISDIWSLVEKLDLPLLVKESTRKDRGGFKYENGKLIIEIFTNIKDEFYEMQQIAGGRFTYSTKGDFIPNSQIIFEEFFHLYQFLNGKIWFENTGGKSWKAFVDIFDEAEAKKMSSSIYRREFYIPQRVPGSLKLVHSVSYLYHEWSIEEIVTQLTTPLKKLYDTLVVFPSGNYEFKTEEITFKPPIPPYTGVEMTQQNVALDLKQPVLTATLYQYPYNGNVLW